MKVKACGITSYEDAVMAVDHGVDALGFNFFPASPRYIRPADARSIIRRLPPFVTIVGLFVNVADAGQVSEMAHAAGVQVLQLHGDETPEYCSRLENWRLIKALRIGQGMIPQNLEEYPVQGFLLDSRHDSLFGGTGQSFDWSLARDIACMRPIILAGGLRPDNVGEAIRVVAPYAVDVCSGVESAPGRKDAVKLMQFMNEVRNVNDLLHRP
ncbi:MAG: phosphoribosylanthranilate isomerase [Acidobacteria bacterium]|nr:phosphoribosylanthranilate isomerase [Acidobacteriota bacterium]